MPKFKMIALSNAAAGTDAEFKSWYVQQHLNDMAAIAGVTGASFQQFAGGNDRWRYLAVYDVETDDPTAVLAEIKRRSGTDLMPISPALAIDEVFFGTFGPALAAD